MISKRTKALMWCAAFPAMVLIAAFGCIMVIPHYGKLAGTDTYYVVFHLKRLVPLLCVCGVVFVSGLISLLYDKRKSREN